MEITAFTKSSTIAPRKVRLIADSIRKLSLDEALKTLSLLEKRGAAVLQKTLKSAVANAKNKNLNEQSLIIKSIDISEGPAFKRFHASTRGRTHPYKKKTSHVRITLETLEGENK